MSDLATKIEIASEPDANAQTMLQLIRDMRPAFEKALPRHMSAERFARVALTTVKSNRGLLGCTAESVLGGFLQAAQLGLEISDVRGQCYLIPRKNRKAGTTEATFQLGYKGMIDLAGRGGITVDAHEVTVEDEFDFRYGTEAYLHHTPVWREKRSDLVAFYSVAEFADGRLPKFTVMGRLEMEGFRDQHRSDDRQGSAWDTNFPAMGRKTVIRRLLGYLPLPVEAAQGIAADDRAVLADTRRALDRPDQVDLEVSDPDPEPEVEE